MRWRIERMLKAPVSLSFIATRKSYDVKNLVIEAFQNLWPGQFFGAITWESLINWSSPLVSLVHTNLGLPWPKGHVVSLISWDIQRVFQNENNCAGPVQDPCKLLQTLCSHASLTLHVFCGRKRWKAGLGARVVSVSSAQGRHNELSTLKTPSIGQSVGYTKGELSSPHS